MAYKLIAIDMDGTLLTDEGRLPEQNIRAMRAAISAGAQIIIATGRPYRAAEWVMKQAEIQGFILSVGGAMINRYPGGESLFASNLQEDVVTDFTNCCRGKGWFWHCVSGSDYHYEVEDEMYRLTEFFLGYPGIQTDFRSKHGIVFNKANVVVQQDSTENAARELHTCIGDRAEVLVSDRCVIDITPKGIHKAVSLLAVASKLGIAADEIIAIGDAESDISMLRAVGLGVCMGNGAEAAKDAVNYIAPTNNDCGVAAVIEKFVL